MNTAQTRLLEIQRSDGAWSVTPEGGGSIEVTALSVIALLGADGRAANRGLAWLRERQGEDGGWPITEAVTVSGWATSIAVLALLRGDPSNPASALDGGRWLLAEEGQPVPWITRLFFRLFPRYNVIDLELDLKGWPWYSGTFGWVEPTAWALIALKSLRGKLHVEDRIDEGERLILDRTCHGGGWNYGNSRVYDEELWPYPDTTALALIALQDRPDLPQVSTGLSALDRMLQENHSVLATSLGLLCRHAYDRDPSGLDERLTARLEETAGWADTRALALAGIALDPTRTLKPSHA